jgi:hypothetical protein
MSEEFPVLDENVRLMNQGGFQTQVDKVNIDQGMKELTEAQAIANGVEDGTLQPGTDPENGSLTATLLQESDPAIIIEKANQAASRAQESIDATDAIVRESLQPAVDHYNANKDAYQEEALQDAMQSGYVPADQRK